MLAYFYDIEALSNVFTLCNFRPELNQIDAYYLVDDPALVAIADFTKLLTDRVHQENNNFDGTVITYDLQTQAANEHLATMFGLTNAKLVNDLFQTGNYPTMFRPVCDTDPGYDDNKHPYLMGYNSYNYDTTMLAMYLYEVFPMDGQRNVSFRPTTANRMRIYNNELFTQRFKTSMPKRLTQQFNPATHCWSETNYQDDRWKIRKCMLMTGRHIDVAKLNEKQQKVALKRLLGMLGYQILESSKLRPGQDFIENTDQLLDLIAYNVSDCVNLKLGIFDHSLYQGKFSLKKGLLVSYPELIYEKLPNKYAPDIRPEAVRRDRLTIDSSSAQLATKSLCPYDHLPDIPVVSFLYPSARKAAELGIQQVNVLEDARAFFYKNFTQPELRAEFDKIYHFYRNIEGKNFNASETYAADYQNKGYQTPCNVKEFSKDDTCLYYYNADGSPSSCFVTFSIGGIHGAEYNKALFDADIQEFNKAFALQQAAQDMYPDPVALAQAKVISLPDENGNLIEYKSKKFLTSTSTLKKAKFRDVAKPVLFKQDKEGGTKLNSNYVFTSADPTNHEDFTSYYPNLLRMLSAFYNEGLGYDRYNEIFENKQNFGKWMKDKTRPEEERQLYSVQREGTKLILNTASGAADATFESNIRMNNIIISMRIIGQLFSWRIGQAQTIAGAKITSTNTDGLFSVLDPAINNPVLERESKDIGVEIEPEETYLISKDSNNRIEMNEKTGKIERASGGTLACNDGPLPTASLAHPAILDWALCEYLITASHNYKGMSLSGPFNDDIGMSILKHATAHFTANKKQSAKTRLLNMFQNVIASSIGSTSYNFGISDDHPGVPIIMQHYNRVFIMKDNTPGTIHIRCAVSKKITPATQQKRQRDHDRMQIHDPLAIQVLMAEGVEIKDIPDDEEAAIKKVTNIEPEWYMLVMNKDLHGLSDTEADQILDNLDYDKYLRLFHDGFEQNWRNKLPGESNGDNNESPTAAPVATPAPKAAKRVATPKTTPAVTVAPPSGVSAILSDIAANQPVVQPVPATTLSQSIPPVVVVRPNDWPTNDCPFDIDITIQDQHQAFRSAIQGHILDIRAIAEALEALGVVAPGYANNLAAVLDEADKII